MHDLIHRRRCNLPKVFEGRSSRVYDLVSRRTGVAFLHCVRYVLSA